MEVIFYYNGSDDRQINKNLITGRTFQGVFRDECTIMNPVIRFQSSDVLRYNYCYIPEFQRYYSITSIKAFRDQYYDVYMEVDVLMSFRQDIYNLNVIVDKQSMESNGDEYIDDSSLVTDNVMFSRIYNYPNGFNNYGEYILITAG